MLKEILASLEGLTDLERAEVLRTLMSGQTVLQNCLLYTSDAADE